MGLICYSSSSERDEYSKSLLGAPAQFSNSLLNKSVHVHKYFHGQNAHFIAVLRRVHQVKKWWNVRFDCARENICARAQIYLCREFENCAGAPSKLLLYSSLSLDELYRNPLKWCCQGNGEVAFWQQDPKGDVPIWNVPLKWIWSRHYGNICSVLYNIRV